MAISVNTNSLQGSFDPNIVDGGAGTIIREANNSDPEAQARLAGKSTFRCKLTATTAVNAINAISLKSAGATFPNDSVRNIRARVWCRKLGADKAAYGEILQTVVGKGAATAPVLTPTTAFTGASAANDPKYVARIPIVGNAGISTANFFTVALTIVSTDVAVRVSTLTGSGLTTGARFDVEVEVGELHILPST